MNNTHVKVEIFLANSMKVRFQKKLKKMIIKFNLNYLIAIIFNSNPWKINQIHYQPYKSGTSFNCKIEHKKKTKTLKL